MTLGILRAFRRARLFVALVGGLVMLLPIRLLTFALSANRRPSQLGTLYLRILLWGLRIRVETRGIFAENSLIVANHISWSDVLVLGSIRPTLFVAKSEVRNWPLLGLLARLNGTLFVKRDVRQLAREQVSMVTDALARGPVALFPEGTTGCGAHVLPFKPTLFAAAAGRPVQPVSIRYRPRGRDWAPAELASFAWDGDKDFWPHLLETSGGRPMECLVVAHSPMTGTPDGRKSLAHICRQIIADALGERTSEEPV